MKVAWFTLEDLGVLLRRHRADDAVTKAIALVEIRRYLELGYDRVFLHNVGANQAAFVQTFGREVLPQLG